MTLVPPLVLVTDDGRLAARGFAVRLEELLEAGLPAVWLHARHLPRGQLLARAREVRELAGGRAEIWVGDRPEVAAAARADRLQLSERGRSVAAVRARLPGVRVGRSVHGVPAARRGAAEGVDHLVVGTIHPTPSHPRRPSAGPGLLAEIRSALGEVTPPLVAIGGMTPERVPAVVAAGADGVAAIRALWDAEWPGETVARFLAAVGRGRPKPLH